LIFIILYLGIIS